MGKRWQAVASNFRASLFNSDILFSITVIHDLIKKKQLSLGDIVY